MTTSRRQPVIALIVCVAAAACLSSAPPGAPPAAIPLQQAAPAAKPAAAPLPLTLPNKDGALKFGVMGDFGNGRREQYQLGEQMARVQSQFPFELMLTVGDNLYGGQRPNDFV